MNIHIYGHIFRCDQLISFQIKIAFKPNQSGKTKYMNSHPSHSAFWLHSCPLHGIFKIVFKLEWAPNSKKCWWMILYVDMFIVHVSRVLRMTVIVIVDWRFDILSGSHLQAQVNQRTLNINMKIKFWRTRALSIRYVLSAEYLHLNFFIVFYYV